MVENETKYTWNNQSRQNCRDHTKIDNDSEILSQKKKNRNMEVDDNERS